MYELLGLAVAAGVLALVIGMAAENRPAFMIGLVFRVAALGLVGTFVGLRAAAAEGPFSPALNFASISSLVALGGWYGWAWLESPVEEADEEASDDDADWF